MLRAYQFPSSVHRHRRITGDRLQLLPLGYHPGSTLSNWGNSSAMDLNSQFSRQSCDRQIVFWQITSQLLRCENFGVARNLRCGGRQVKVFGKEGIGLLAVVELIVMGPWVNVFVPPQCVL